MELMTFTSISRTLDKLRKGNHCMAIDFPDARAIQTITILILFFAATFTARGQEQERVQLRDTTAVTLQLFDPNALPIKLSLFPPPQLQTAPESSLRFFFQSSPFPSQQFSRKFKEKLDLTAPLKLELADQEKYRTWRSILGSIQAGGTAYILYQHIKKYGLKQN
jgi:hypothetical protein